MIELIAKMWCFIWNPLFKRDIGKIESVQRQFTKRLKGLYRVCHALVDAIDLILTVYTTGELSVI